MSKRKNVVDELRAAIRRAEKAGVTRYRIAKLSGVDESQLSKIVHGKREPLLSTAAKIINAIGGRLTIIMEDARQ